MALRLELFLIWAGVSMFLQLDPVNGDNNCVFPFIYGNKKHFDCIYQGAIYPWCSLDADYIGRWKYCTSKDYAKCVFPFIYQGKS
nr:seminal plasma protein A3-like [Odocoileus virginianus texanus]